MFHINNEYGQNTRSYYVYTWYTEDGDKYPWGRFMPEPLDEDIIGYHENDWVQTGREVIPAGNEGDTITTRYSKYVAILFSEDH